MLQELPERIETDEWLTLEGSAADIYRWAVESGNFMDMRRAAFMTDDPYESPKLARLLEITTEAADRGLKTVVFSFFRDVIDRIHAGLGSRAAGPITGSVPAERRQQIVDQFTDSAAPAVLVSQVEAGGVGLNLQAASVVILAEPQWKPSTEEQAIARCHRMGQVRRVEVHRLLTEDSVDKGMVEILRGKSVLFDSYARGSTIKDATPDAVDTGDHAKPEKAMSQREQERQIISAERQRLGLPKEAPSKVVHAWLRLSNACGRRGPCFPGGGHGRSCESVVYAPCITGEFIDGWSFSHGLVHFSMRRYPPQRHLLAHGLKP